MYFQFRPEHMQGLANGTLQQVFSTTGVPLSMVRDAATGQFVGHAVGTISQPYLAIPELAMGGVQIIQTHMGFQKTYRMLDAIQNSLGILQATTALIGIGTVAGVALSAVNLHQTLKLRDDIKQLKLEVKDGFIDLKQVLKDQGQEIIQRIDQVAQDIKFEQHRLEFIKAYGQFLQATKLIKIAILSDDLSVRNADLANARQTLGHALAIYNNPHLLSETCAAGKLRRLECVWAIEQAIALTYQLQNQSAVVSSCLSHLQDQIRTDSLSVIESCETEDELDFLFPEIIRIHNHDLAVLESWQAHTDWIQTLSPDDKLQLASSDFSFDQIDENHDKPTVIAEPEEQLLYESLKKKSHYQSLRDQLKFMIKPDLRQGHESYISQQAIASNYKALAPSNWQAIPDLTVANLYWYFKQQEA
jgi:hypothetical protein